PTPRGVLPEVLVIVTSAWLTPRSASSWSLSSQCMGEALFDEVLGHTHAIRARRAHVVHRRDVPGQRRLRVLDVGRRALCAVERALDVGAPERHRADAAEGDAHVRERLPAPLEARGHTHLGDGLRAARAHLAVVVLARGRAWHANARDQLAVA